MTSVPELAGEVSRGMLFGECSGNFLESAETERREREKKIKLEKKKREDAIRKAEEEKRQQEFEDFQFALEEQQKMNQELKSMGGGHGRPGPLVSRYDTPHTRTRSRLHDSQDESNFFRRERNIRNHLNQLPGGEGIHSNNSQIQFWTGKPQMQYSSFHRRADPEEFEDEERQRDSSPDQFEDAPSMQKSPTPLDTSQPSENSSFRSCSSSVSASPVLAYAPQLEVPKSPPPERHSPREQKNPPRQKRGNRIAANFSNCRDDEMSDGVTPPQQDFFPVTSSAARPLAPHGARNARTNNTVSINNVRPSQRIITPNSNISALILRHLSPNGDFILNDRDFPPLK